MQSIGIGLRTGVSARCLTKRAGTALLLNQLDHYPTGVPFQLSTRRHRSTSNINPSYAGHVAINTFQRSLLAVGSAVTSLLNPYRHDMIAVLGETTSGRQLPAMRDALLKGDEEGRRILKERPRLKSETIDLEVLTAMQEGSFGRAYTDWLQKCGVSPDTREPVSGHILHILLLTPTDPCQSY